MRRDHIIALVLLGVAAVGAFLAYPYIETARYRFTVTGIDVSHHQGAIDWRRLARAKVTFAYIKATEGKDFLDTRFQTNWREAKQAGIARGAYHFFRACRSGALQAKYFIARVPKEAGMLPPVLDAEDTDPCPSGVARLDQVQEIKAFLNEVEAAFGCRPIIYTTPEYHRTYLDGALSGERFWLRSIHVPPLYGPRDWVFWQYHHRGRRDGITGDVDLNAFRGSKEEFAAFAAKGC
jgi:lysozyme